MTSVMTVTGPVEPDRLGRVLVHEHVQVSYHGDRLDPHLTYDRDRCLETAVQRMRQLLDHGVRTFVDATAIDFGRDAELLREVAERSGIQLVCATGFYFEHDGIGIPYYWRVRSVDEIVELYLHEIRNGIGGTGVRPGVVKMASGDPPGEHDRKVMRAAAIAARESGLPVITHSENSNGWEVQQEILESEGVDLSRCLIGHQDQQATPDPMVQIARRGSFVGVDRIGFDLLAPEEQRLSNIAALVREGHADRICLSQDHACCLVSPRYPYPVPEGSQETFRRVESLIYEQWYGRPFTHLLTDFVPKLVARGVDESTVERMLTDNARRLLIGE